jgi:hypothetical protein
MEAAAMVLTRGRTLRGAVERKKKEEKRRRVFRPPPDSDLPCKPGRHKMLVVASRTNTWLHRKGFIYNVC